ncbi:MAG TPA: hypothetical protein VNA16_08910, partial [Abditibacteriaceae bacterium]|nr:hypothetical protein [Abditibacteriaceae bacterium]
MKKRNKNRQRCYAVVSLVMAVLIANVASAFAQDLKKHRPELVLQIGHSAEVKSVAFSSDSKT